MNFSIKNYEKFKMSDSNTFDFYDDDNIHKDIIKKSENNKELERKIKYDLEKLINWFEIENLIIREKEKMIKKYYEELRTLKAEKKMELWNLYGANNVENIRKKYNIRL